MSAIKTDNRYQVKPIEKPPYSFAVWDSEEKRDIAYTNEEVTALGYAAQMNEKGFIEP